MAHAPPPPSEIGPRRPGSWGRQSVFLPGIVGVPREAPELVVLLSALPSVAAIAHPQLVIGRWCPASIKKAPVAHVTNTGSI